MSSGQLLLTDYTVVRVMLAAVITGMVGIHVLHHFGLVSLHPKQGSIGTSGYRGIIFGLGFGILGTAPALWQEPSGRVRWMPSSAG